MIGPPMVTNMGEVDGVAYSHEHRLLVSASGDPGLIMVWNTFTHEAVLGPLGGHTSLIHSIALSRDGRRALTTSLDRTVKMWAIDRNLKGPAPAMHTSEGHRDFVVCLAFSQCGKRVASLGYDDQTILVWDTLTGKPLLDPINSGSQYTKIIFSPDGGQIFAFGSSDGDATFRAWNAQTGELEIDEDVRDADHEDTSIKHLAFRSLDRRLLTCSSNGYLRLWDLEDGGMVEEPCIWGANVKVIALSPDGLSAIVRDDNRVPCHLIWDTKTWQPLPLTLIDEECIKEEPVIYSPSGRFFFINHTNRRLQVWNAQTGALHSCPSMFSGKLQALAFSPNDDVIAFAFGRCSGNNAMIIWIWNTHTGSLKPWLRHLDDVTSLTFSSDGRKLASASGDGQVRIWDTAELLGDSQASAGFLGVGKHMSDGWVMDVDGHLLFWVPTDHRSWLVWPGYTEAIGGNGIRTKLDLSEFGHGRDWALCFRGESRTSDK